MTIQECYDVIGGNYGDIVSRLRTEERIARFLIKVADDKSFDLLKTSLEERNMEEAFRAAHTLKGVAQNLSFTELYERAVTVTEILRGGSLNVAAEMPALEKSYLHTVKSIEALE